MKQTSLQANKAADQFKGSHKKIIMHFLNDEMTGKDIEDISPLKFPQIMRRMSELERENKVITKGSKNGFTIYKKK